MSTIDIQNQILDAIETIVTNEVQNASFDKTIQATISKVVDQSTGKYLVKYQDSAFYAYATSTDVSYTVGALVYVLVPGNDMSNDKTIIGSVDNLGTNYLNLISNSDKFEPTGENLASSTDSFGLCSYKETDSEILYSREQDINLIGLDTDAAAVYLNRSNYLKLGASFQTNLDKKQKYSGNYGIIFKIKYKDNDTGSNLIRVYTIDIDDMNGDPYNFTTAIAQSKYYEITEEFVSIEEISIFSESFPYTEDNKDDDIFVLDLVISGGDLLDDDTLSGSSLTLLALQGDFFTDTIISDKTLTAQVRIKGNVVDADSSLLEYYWFKENNAVTTDSAGYNKLAGKGWECLNDYSTTTLEDGSTFVTYVSGSSVYTVTKANNLAKENIYKCVVVYNDDTIITREKTIYNYSSEYDITIESDGGTHFYFGAGYPNLTCFVNGAEDTEKTYHWSMTTSDGTFSLLAETTDENEEYNTAKAAYEELETELAAETIFIEQTQDQLDALQATMNKYNTILRIEDNHAYRVPIREIINYTIYKCSVYDGENYIGTASITLFNSLDISQHNLIITNGDQVFKYDEAGTTPANPALDDPVTVLPLGFNFYNNEGTLISHDAIDLSEVIWQIPKTNTLISVPVLYSDNLDSEDDDYYYYTGVDEISFTIKDKYNVNSQNNTVKLTVCYKGEYFIAESTLTFIKEGESGTNGTDFICKIVANATDEDFTDYPTVIYDTSTSTYSLNYTPVSADYWFKAQLWKDTELIYEGNQSTDNTDGEGLQNQVTGSEEEFDLSWKILYNNYGDGHADYKLFDVVEGHTTDESGNIIPDTEQGKMSLNTEYISQNNVAMILECQITYNEKVYYADLPIVFAVVSSSDYSISWDRGTGFRYVVYTTDGQSPQYDFSNPFEVTVKQKIDDDMIDISTLASSSYTVTFDWSVYGTTYTGGAEVESNDLILKTVSSLPRNQKRILPTETSDGLCLTDNILCVVSRDDTELARILMPIHFYLNKYGNALLNGWNGNSISINNDEGIILTPQVGAGSKNEKNQFTGILMGSVQKSADSDIESGLFGFYEGAQTLELNAETGVAKFGKENEGQIIIDPDSGEALIYGGNYDEEAGTGMVINLSKPTIEWASGNFKVDENGNVSATGFATSSQFVDLQEQIDDLDSFSWEDIVIGEEYCLGDSIETPPAEDDVGWKTGVIYSNPDEGKYAWSRTVAQAEDGTLYYYNYNCLVQQDKHISLQITEYVLSALQDVPDEEGYISTDSDGNTIVYPWTDEKPTSSDPDRPYLWTRLHTTYVYGQSTENTTDEYTNYYMDSLWNQLYDINNTLTESITNILQRIGDGGVVQIEDNYIMVADSSTYPTKIIFIDSSGIGFIADDGTWTRNDDGWPDTESLLSGATSTWSIDGTLDMQNIIVKNLTVSNIYNEKLELGYNPEGNHGQITGDLDMYDKAGRLCFETVTDDSDSYILGFKIYKYTSDNEYNGYIYLSRSGIIEYNASDIAIYGNDGNDSWYANDVSMHSAQIWSSDNDGYGAVVVPMYYSSTHYGIGFLKR